LRLETQTESIWTYVFLNKNQFINKLYNKTATWEVIEEIPFTAPQSLQEWRELHYKWSIQSKNKFFAELTDCDLF
jgi:hypothetical protein